MFLKQQQLATLEGCISNVYVYIGFVPCLGRAQHPCTVMLANKPLCTSGILPLHVEFTSQFHYANLRSELHDRHIYATPLPCQAYSHSSQVPHEFFCHTSSPACRPGFIGLPKGTGCEGNNGNVLQPMPRLSYGPEPSVHGSTFEFEGDRALHAGASAADSNRSRKMNSHHESRCRF